MTTVNTSRAKDIKVDFKDIDNIPLSLVYNNGAEAIDLDLYRFDFILKENERTIATYTILSGEAITAHLAKTGDDNNVLNMEAMFEDVRNKCVGVTGTKYRLVQKVTHPDASVFVHIRFEINAGKY